MKFNARTGPRLWNSLDAGIVSISVFSDNYKALGDMIWYITENELFCISVNIQARIVHTAQKFTKVHIFTIKLSLRQ